MRTMTLLSLSVLLFPMVHIDLAIESSTLPWPSELAIAMNTSERELGLCRLLFAVDVDVGGCVNVLRLC